MRKNKVWLFCAAAIVFLTSGCEALLIGGAIMGGSTGTYYYISGEAQADYKAPFDTVWAACEKAMADMRALDVRPYKEIGKGNIAAFVNNQDVKIAVTYRGKNTTTVAVRVGWFGDEIASQILHDKIAENIPKN